MINRSEKVATIAEQIANAGMDRKKALSLMSRLEASHLSFPLPGRLIGQLGTVVRVLTRVVERTGKNIPGSRSVARKLVGQQLARLFPLAFQHLTKESLSRPGVAATLDEDIEDVTILIDGTPQVVDLSAGGDEDLIDVPSVPKSALPTLEGSAVAGPELQTPAPNGLVGDDDASFGEEVLDIPEAQRKPVVEPHGVADDLGWESVAVISGFAFAHRRIVPNSRLR
jgi:hypothetical protein